MEDFSKIKKDDIIAMLEESRKKVTDLETARRNDATTLRSTLDKYDQLFSEHKDLQEENQTLKAVKLTSEMDRLKINEDFDVKPLDSLERLAASMRPRSSLSMKINNSIPYFYGKSNENVDDWLYTANKIFEATATTDSRQRVIFACSFLKENALHNFQVLKKLNPNLKWDQFETEMKNRYRPKDFQQKLREKLGSLKQVTTFYDYLFQFRAIMNQIESMKDEDKIFFFTQGLNQKTKNYVCFQRPDGLENTIQMAENYETYCNLENSKNNFSLHHVLVRGNNTTTPFTYKKSNQPNSKKRNYQNFKAHGTVFNQTKRKFNNNYGQSNSSSSNSINNSSRSTFSKRPFNIESNKNNSNNSSSNGTNNRHYNNVNYNKNNGTNNRVYAAAHKPNESFKFNPAPSSVINCQTDNKVVYTLKNSQDSPPLLSVAGQLNKHDVNFTIDTGATISVASLDTVKRLNLKVLKDNNTISTADGSTSHTLGKTEVLTIEINNFSVKLELIITKILHVDVLLGLDWFSKSNALIDPANRCLTFPAQTVQLNTHISDDTTIFLSEIQMADDDDFDENYFPSTSNMELHTGITLPDTEKCEFENFINEYKDLFAFNYTELGCCNMAEFSIETTTETPIRCIPYRQPVKIIEELKDEINKMLAADIIRPGKTGTWASPAYIINQKNGKRFIVNFRTLNSITKKYLHPINRIDDTIDKLNGSRIFTALDLRKGYFQIPISEESKHKSGFIVPFGIYEFNRLPFGVSNGPGFFHYVMKILLGSLDFVQIYFDDITVHSNNLNEYLGHLRFVFKILADANLKLNFGKCKWLTDRIS